MKIIKVRWLDSIADARTTWGPVEDHIPEVADLRHTTVGFLAAERDDFIVVCSSSRDDLTSFSLCMTIPRMAIVEVHEMPKGKGPGPSIKHPRVYEALRDQGMSKTKAAKISNAQGGKKGKGK